MFFGKSEKDHSCSGDISIAEMTDGSVIRYMSEGE